MKKMKYFSPVALTVILAIALGACMVIRTLLPMSVLPRLDIPNMVLLSLTALLLDHYLADGAKRYSILMLPMAALSFGLLPWAAGFATPLQALKLAGVGGVVFTLCAWLFASILDRLSTGPAAKAAPVFTALGLYLATQCFSGMIL